jgi:hypothetical protein
MSTLKSYVGYLITYGWVDSKTKTTGILFKNGMGYQVLKLDGKVERIDSMEQIEKVHGKLKQLVTIK